MQGIGPAKRGSCELHMEVISDTIALLQLPAELGRFVQNASSSEDSSSRDSADEIAQPTHMPADSSVCLVQISAGTTVHVVYSSHEHLQ